MGITGGLATGFSGGTGVAVETIPTGMVALFARNASAGYEDWLLQLDEEEPPAPTGIRYDLGWAALALNRHSYSHLSIRYRIKLSPPLRSRIKLMNREAGTRGRVNH